MTRTIMVGANVRPFLLGAGAFAATEATWLVAVAQGAVSGRWVMVSATGVGVALVVQALVGWLGSFWLRWRIVPLASCAAGVVTAVVTMLFVVGPGNLWPIVVAVDLAMLIPGLLAGFLGGFLVRRWVFHAASQGGVGR